MFTVTNNLPNTRKRNKSKMVQYLTFLQHRGVLGHRTDHAVKVVAVGLRLGPGLVMELDHAPGHPVSRLAVTMAPAVG